MSEAFRNHLITERRETGCINACRLAVEELAKSHLLTQGASYKDSDTEKWRWIWDSFTDHREKLRVIEYELHWPAYQDRQQFHDRVTVLRNLREDVMYVQFDTSTKSFHDPEEVLEKYGGAEAEARRQITYLHHLIALFFPMGRLSVEDLLGGFRSIQAQRREA